MKSLINLCSALLDDLSSICSVDTARDLCTIKSRAQHEGVSFFTITLPNFAQDFESALARGKVDSTLFVGWKRRGCLPSFLRGFTSLVFGSDGRILDEHFSTPVYCVRQLCRVFKKVRIPCSQSRVEKAFEKYKTTEAALPSAFEHDMPDAQHFVAVCNAIWTDVLGVDLNTFDLVPKHGPGATAERISGNSKYVLRSWTERLETAFPVTEFGFTSLNQIDCDRSGLKAIRMVEVQDETPVRVISVPKDLKAPRIIAIEPVCMQYTQQALSRWLMDKIQRSDLIGGAIRFNDQSVNQHMAVRGSRDGSYATIDLSDASDRVPLSHVRAMLGGNPDLLRAIEATRSTTAKLPTGEVVSLKKFASMGSALCFPIESMYFYSIIVHALLRKRNESPTRRRIHRISRRIHIFGDDIIVPSGETDTVLEALAMYNCKVNTAKSFWTGRFRESCGCDAYHGEDVTPVYLREMCPSSKRSHAALVSWISTSNQLHKVGLWKTADYMKRVVESVLGVLPVVAETSPGLGWVSYNGIPDSGRLCPFTHRPLVKTFKVETCRVKDPLDGYPALLKYFLNAKDGGDTLSHLFPKVADKKHLASSVRHGTVSRKRHWVPVT